MIGAAWTLWICGALLHMLCFVVLGMEILTGTRPRVLGRFGDGESVALALLFYLCAGVLLLLGRHA